jgi:hypothetical protein
VPVVMLKPQLAMLPTSIASSSTTYSFHVPFGAVPSKIERLTFPLGVGAGAGKPSPPGSL